MSDQRLYSEEEVAAIFNRAVEAQETAQRRIHRAEGLTLKELQEIGEEAGITPEFIAHAASTMDSKARVLPSRTLFRIPYTVARTVDLPGPVTKGEWERIVADLRVTFQATGRVSNEPGHLHWRNGNLHVMVEPSEAGSRLHFRSLNANLRTALIGGSMTVGFALIMALMLVLSSDFTQVNKPFLIAAIGMTLFGFGAFRLTAWQRERELQMEQIGSRVLERMESERSPEARTATEGISAPAKREAFLDVEPSPADPENQESGFSGDRTRSGG